MSCKRTCCRKCTHDAGIKKVICFDKSGNNQEQCTYDRGDAACIDCQQIQDQCIAFEKKKGAE